MHHGPEIKRHGEKKRAELAPSVLSWTHSDLLAFEHFRGRNEQMNTS
jgi:hypothetical protein